MLNRLLESKARRNRSLLGMTTSISAHLVVVVAAIHATAQSRPRATEVIPGTTVVRFVPERIRTSTQETEQRASSSKWTLPRPFKPFVFDPKIAPINFIPPSPTDPADFQRAATSIQTGTPPLTPNSGGVFRADQVERQVTLLAGGEPPRYPEALRNAGIEGKVVAQFTVSELGLVERDSVRFMQSDNVLFEESVRSALQRMRFSPAEVGGRKVRQVVQMPFVFTLSSR